MKSKVRADPERPDRFSQELRPWHEVQAIYNAKHGTNLSYKNTIRIGWAAIQKLRAAAKAES